MPKAKGKKTKDPNAPKRPLSAFMLFNNVVRPRVREENPNAVFGEIGKKLGQLWKDASPEEKKIYEEKAAEEKLRYQRENKAYLDSKQDSESDSEDDRDTKRKRRKREKDPDAPKKPLTPFMLFSQSIRPKIRAEHPEAKFADMGKIIGAKWQELTDDEKKPFHECHEAAKLKHEEEMEKYKKRHK